MAFNLRRYSALKSCSRLRLNSFLVLQCNGVKEKEKKKGESKLSSKRIHVRRRVILVSIAP